jgi:hypothetical protein
MTHFICPLELLQEVSFGSETVVSEGGAKAQNLRPRPVLWQPFRPIPRCKRVR